ncbi:MAG: hypothetical protein V4819_16140 [Verrucomicrobiota bacterium]
MKPIAYHTFGISYSKSGKSLARSDPYRRARLTIRGKLHNSAIPSGTAKPA